jgi:hypothetical protein
LLYTHTLNTQCYKTANSLYTNIYIDSYHFIPMHKFIYFLIKRSYYTHKLVFLDRRIGTERAQSCDILFCFILFYFLHSEIQIVFLSVQNIPIYHASNTFLSFLFPASLVVLYPLLIFDPAREVSELLLLQLNSKFGPLGYLY